MPVNNIDDDSIAYKYNKLPHYIRESLTNVLRRY